MSEEYYASLKERNDIILSRFKAEGVNLKKKTEFNFVLELHDLNTCNLYRQRAREVIKDFGAIFIVVNGDNEKLFMLSIEMKPDAERITKIEYELAKLAFDFGDFDVSWEFAGGKVDYAK